MLPIGNLLPQEVMTMKNSRQSGNFFLCLLLNLILGFPWSIPAWILLGLHFWLDISIWWFVGGMILWVCAILFSMWFLQWAAKCGNEPDPPKENKNPYSKKAE